MFILYVNTTSMYSYQKLTGHKLCQFLQHEGYLISCFEEKKKGTIFFSLHLSSKKEHISMIIFFNIYFPFSENRKLF